MGGIRPEWEHAWAQSDMRAKVIAFFGGDTVPALLDQILPGDDGVLAAPAHWHCAIYGDLVLRKVGSTFTAPDCYRVLRARGIGWDKDRVAEALVGFLAHLKDAGQVTYAVTEAGRPAGDIRVVANLPAAPAPARAVTPAPTVEAPALAPEPAPEAAAEPAVERADRAPSTGIRVPGARVPAPEPVKAAREPRSAAESTWLRDTTHELTTLGLAAPTVQALIDVARWGTPVTVEARSA